MLQKKIIITHKETKIEIEIPDNAVVEIMEFSEKENSNSLSSREKILSETHTNTESQEKQERKDSHVFLKKKVLQVLDSQISGSFVSEKNREQKELLEFVQK